MNEKVENLILEYLRSMRGDIGSIKAGVATLRAEMVAMRQQVTGVITWRNFDHTEIASIKTRLDIIEKRLEIVE